MAEKLPHLRLDGPSEVREFTSTQAGGGKRKRKQWNRAQHGEYIQRQLEAAWQESNNEFAAIHAERHGIYLEFQSSPGFELAVQSLEDLRAGIRLCNVRTDTQIVDDTEVTTSYATVYIPKTKRQVFFDKVEKYLNEETAKGKPKNAPLIDSIEGLRKALLVESFWTDDRTLIPRENAEWCEVWLRSDEEDTVHHFENLLASQNINSKQGVIRFPERVVKLVCASVQQLEELTRHCDDIAEYRRAKETADFLLNQTPAEQSEWIQDLIERTSVNQDASVSICILDTGVNHAHPLIQPILEASDCQSVNTDWGGHDDEGHGTLMAGLAAYGDLQSKLEGTDAIQIEHRLESVKVLPPRGSNDPELWGDITKQAISLAEIQSPTKKRVNCMAVTADDTRDRGKPSSWSAALDQVAAGANGDDKRLLIVSAGNCTANLQQLANYPDAQITDSVHDPAQSWNALTVGAYTELADITDPTLAGYTPVAGEGQLSPFTTTSSTWEDKWPIKPEVVFEGGNVAVGPDGFVSECDDLGLVSTFYKPQERLLDRFSMTSAATAQAAYFAAQIQSLYPDYWPETVRALLVHSARWSEALRSQFAGNGSKTELKKMLQICGYGVPSLDRALHCASNSLTLIAEAELQPFEKQGSSYRTKDMHLYELPWPTEVLQELGATEVEMRVTLSYFIEPGPGEVGWKDRYRYASHALRFDLNSSTETQDEFIRRINKAARDAENGKPDTSSPTDKWLIGSQARDKGSIHSDIWKGTASDLASSNLIAISPKVGWWRERHHLKKYNKTTRYTLIVSITAPEQGVDIYTPVAVQIAQPIMVTSGG
ncbi:MAG: S8 family peptidase [Mariprofundaceae bacterium]|nr:S8 family peptidase [Mariprofundaceae bacterium]